MNDGQAMLLTERQIVNAIRWRRVHDPGAGFRADEIGADNPESVGVHIEVIEQSLIAHADEFCALDLPDDFVLEIFQDLHRAGLRQG